MSATMRHLGLVILLGLQKNELKLFFKMTSKSQPNGSWLLVSGKINLRR